MLTNYRVGFVGIAQLLTPLSGSAGLSLALAFSLSRFKPSCCSGGVFGYSSAMRAISVGCTTVAVHIECRHARGTDSCSTD